MKRIFLSAFLFFVASYFCNAQSDSTAQAAKLMQLEQQLNDDLPGDSSLWSKY